MSLFGAREGAFRGSGSALKDGLTFYWSELVSRGCGLCQCAWYREASGFPLSWSASLAEVGLLLCTRPPRTKRGCDELARIAGLRSNTQYSNVNLLKTASIWVLSSKFVCFFSLNEMKVRFLFFFFFLSSRCCDQSLSVTRSNTFLFRYDFFFWSWLVWKTSNIFSDKQSWLQKKTDIHLC